MSKRTPKPLNRVTEYLLRRRKVQFWGRNYFIRPRLVDWVHGDGKQLMWYEPMDTRPDYYIVRVDSSVSPNNSDDNCFADLVIENLTWAIRDQFGEGYEEWKHENGRTYKRRNPFPALSDDCGASWGTITE